MLKNLVITCLLLSEQHTLIEDAYFGFTALNEKVQ